MRSNTINFNITEKQSRTIVFLFLGSVCSTPYGPPNKYSTGYYPVFVIAGHFNNDRKLDFVAANFQDDVISVLLGNGDGSFQNQMTYFAGYYPRSLAKGDFNHDSILDISVVSYRYFGILFGNGDGTFQNQTG